MKVVLATSLWERLTGLLVRSRCANGEALMLAPCKSVHSFGMQDALDVAFVDKEGRIVASERNVQPSRVCSHPKAAAVLERRSRSASAYWPLEGERLWISSSMMTFDGKEERV